MLLAWDQGQPYSKHHDVGRCEAVPKAETRSEGRRGGLRYWTGKGLRSSDLETGST
jgi:hypothetical protein